MQRTERRARRLLAVGLVGERERLVIVEFRNNRVDLRVEPADLVEMGGHHLPGGELLAGNLRRQFDGGHEADIVGHAKPHFSIARTDGTRSDSRIPPPILPIAL